MSLSLGRTRKRGQCVNASTPRFSLSVRDPISTDHSALLLCSYPMTCSYHVTIKSKQLQGGSFKTPRRNKFNAKSR